MLTNTEVQGARIKKVDGIAKPYKLFDQGGLHLFVSATGTKIWRYQFRLHSKQGLYTIGKYPHVTLAEARDKHRDAQKLVDKGINPSTAKQDAKKAAQQTKADSFAQVTELWLEWFRDGKSNRHVSTTEARLRNHVLPALGATPINDLTARHLTKFVTRVQDDHGRETADRCLMVIGQILRWARANHHVEQNVHADIKPSDILKSPKVVNFASLEEKDLPGLLQTIEIYQGSPLARLGMKLMAYTLLRTGELITLRWTDVDLEAATITIPGERMKSRRDHMVPLSRQALHTLRLLQKISGAHSSGYVFPGTQGAATMSNMTLLTMLRRMGYGKKHTGHGWRSVASTILNENNFNRDWVEMALAHVPQGVRAAYNKALYLRQRREMLQWYADRLDKLCSCQ